MQKFLNLRLYNLLQDETSLVLHPTSQRNRDVSYAFLSLLISANIGEWAAHCLALILLLIDAA